MWTTLNEPWCSAFLGYASGVHAPGRTEPARRRCRPRTTSTSAHGLAGRAVRSVLGEDTQLSVTLNLHVTRPVDPDSAADRDAVRQLDAVGNRVFLGPMLDGAYPADLLADTASVTDWSFVQDGDEATSAVPLSVLGINYYSTSRARHYTGDGPEAAGRRARRLRRLSPWVGADDVEFLPQPGPYTAMGWNIDPSGMTELLTDIGTRYPDLPLMVTENGAAFYDVVSDGRPGARRRPGLLPARPHRRGRPGQRRRASTCAATSCGRCWTTSSGPGATTAGSASSGSTTTPCERTVKDSAHWYAELIRTGQLPPVGRCRRLTSGCDGLSRAAGRSGVRRRPGTSGVALSRIASQAPRIAELPAAGCTVQSGRSWRTTARLQGGRRSRACRATARPAPHRLRVQHPLRRAARRGPARSRPG